MMLPENQGIIPIDTGNAYIKTDKHSISAGLKKHITPPPAVSDVIFYDGAYWTLTGGRNPYLKDKTVDERYFVLSLFMIAKELRERQCFSNDASISLAIGLPPGHYSDHHKAFEKYYQSRSPVSFEYNGRPISLSFANVFCFLQGFSAIAPEINRLNKHALMYLVDIGGYTIDIMRLRNGKPDLQYCYSLPKGIITMMNDAKAAVESKYGLLIEEHHFRSASNHSETMLDQDVVIFVEQFMREYAHWLIEQLREMEADLRTAYTVFVGGGSKLLRPYLEDHPLIKSSEFFVDPRANAIGYRILAEAMLRRIRG